MEFKELKLNNIGPYKGLNKFSFETQNDKNTIIIGGKNGSGKTTFLNSIRLALYGPLAFGFKTESKDYLSKVSLLLNNDAADQINSNFYVQIKIALVKNFEKITVTITRSWSVQKSTIKEKVEIVKNNSQLNEAQKDDFFEFLRTTFPPSLLELCFFDGEDITKLSNDELLSTYLNDLSMKLFNLDLFRNLEKDIQNYLTETSNSSDERKLEAERNLLEANLNEKVIALRNVSEQLELLNIELEETEARYKKIKRDFSVHGGLVYEERQQIEKEIILLENNRKQTNDNIKEFIAKYLPFFIANPLLKQLVNQLNDEEDYFVSKVLKDKINKINIEDLFSNSGIKLEFNQENVLKNNLIHQLATTDEVNIIHNASKSEAHQVQSIYQIVNKEQLNTLVAMINENTVDLQKLNKLKQKIKDNESTIEFQDMIVEMEQLSQKIIDLKSEIEQFNEQKAVLHDEIEELNKKYEKIKNDLYKILKTKSSFEETEKILKISKKFQENQLRKKLKDSEYFSTLMFKELLRKKTFISKIHIDPKSFSISLIDPDHKEINKTILSAGEKELMVLSIIWGTIKASKKELPFVLDTLLGRLDKEHKHSVITKLVPKFGKQVMILSTDSEIDEELYWELIPFVSNQYTLVYDSENKKTNIEQHFFNYKSQEKVVK